MSSAYVRLDRAAAEVIAVDPAKQAVDGGRGHILPASLQKHEAGQVSTRVIGTILVHFLHRDESGLMLPLIAPERLQRFIRPVIGHRRYLVALIVPEPRSRAAVNEARRADFSEFRRKKSGWMLQQISIEARSSRVVIRSHLPIVGFGLVLSDRTVHMRGEEALGRDAEARQKRDQND